MRRTWYLFMTAVPKYARITEASATICRVLVVCLLYALQAWNSPSYGQALPTQHWDLTDPFKMFIHESWTSEHGLPQDVITAIAQTPDGYLWLGTQSGLVRFNGVAFKIYDRYNTPVLMNEFIRRLAVSDDSTLWVGTDHGGVVSLHNDTISSHRPSDSLSVEGTRVVIRSKNHGVWVAIPGLGVWKSEGAGWKTVSCSRPLSSVWAGYEDTDGTLWLGENGALVHILGDSAVWIGASQGMPRSQVLSMIRDSKGTLLFGTRQEGLFRLSKDKVVPLPVSSNLRRAVITGLCNDPGGGVWIASFDKGLLYYDGDTVRPCVSNPLLPPLHLLSVAVDREGSMWFGTAGDGLHRLRKGVAHYVKVAEPGVSSQVWAVLLRGKELWVGIRENGLRRIAGGRILRPPMTARLSEATVCAFAEGDHGDLWIGTESGLFRMSGNTTTEVFMPDGKSFTNVYALLRDHTGALWIGGQGLFRMSHGKIARIEGMPSGLSVNYLLEDEKRNLWIGSDANGVGVIRGEKSTFYTTDSGLTSNTILCLFEDRLGGLWCGTQGGGLDRFKDGRWGAVTTENGLLNNYVNTIIRSADSTLWMSTNQGLFGCSEQALIDVTDHKSSTIDGVSVEAHDGLQSTEFGGGLQTCSARTADGTLWFVSLKGLVGYNPRTVLRNPLPPPVLIESIEVNGQSLQPRDGMEVGPGVRSIQFGYVGLSYTVPTATRYKYFLEGSDNDWVDGKNQRLVTYTNLSPGTYVFHVLAANSDGVWSVNDRSLRITILPRFWQTVLFELLCLVVLVSLILVAFRLRVWQILKREEQLKLRIEEAVAKIKILSGLIPICANCKKIRDDKGYWNDVSQYITEHSEAVLSHGICPDCAEKLYGDELRRIRDKKNKGTP